MELSGGMQAERRAGRRADTSARSSFRCLTGPSGRYSRPRSMPSPGRWRPRPESVPMAEQHTTRQEDVQRWRVADGSNALEVFEEIVPVAGAQPRTIVVT